MFGRLRALFRKKTSSLFASESSEQIFSQRHTAFRRFLSSWNAFQVTMTDLEYTLCCERPFGLYRVHALCTNVATQVYQCIKQLEKLDSKHCAELTERFGQLQKDVLAAVYQDEVIPCGPLTLPLGDSCLNSEVASLIDPATLRLEKLRALCPENVPDGFVVTAAACQKFFLQKALSREIARIVQSHGGYGTANLLELSQNLTDLVARTPLSADLVESFVGEVKRLRQKYPQSGMRLLFRGRLWPRASGQAAYGIQDPGLLLWGPSVSLDADSSVILDALHATLAKKRSAQALVYRRARGLTDRDAGMCITCMVVAESTHSGLAHTGNPLQKDDSNIYLYSCSGLPQDMEYATLPIETHCLLADSQAHNGASSKFDTVAELAKKLASHEKVPLSVTWLVEQGGDVRLLLVRPMILAQQLEDSLPTTANVLAPPIMSGGICANPGRVYGTVFVARSWEDAHNFPKGAILVVPDDQYLWASLIDDTAGIIVCGGHISSRLGSLAREFGRPALFGVSGAMNTLCNGQKITLCADKGEIYQGRQDALLENIPKLRDFMPGSPVFRMLQMAGEHILPLTLNVDSLDFRADKCSTYHDIARYCHEMAVSSMFSLGSDRQHAHKRVRQLRDKVLKQFWVINLNDGFASLPSGPAIDLEDIVSLPMQALWYGMSIHPWEGPPPVDGKGFMSVLFEATANPHLDPASQSNFFSEKNYFLITREYCSLHSRFGFHFVSVESRLGRRQSENYVQFQLRGGGANIERRILRVRFVADLLWEFGFNPQIQNDAVSARLEGMDMEEGKHLLAVAGYMTIHTRQLDMIMQDATQVAERYKIMLAHCKALFTGKTDNAKG